MCKTYVGRSLAEVNLKGVNGLCDEAFITSREIRLIYTLPTESSDIWYHDDSITNFDHEYFA